MSTRCAIIMYQPPIPSDAPGRIGDYYAGVYCHNSGDVDGVGEVLRQHYRDARKVADLLALGELSQVGETPTCGTVAYARDRDEELLPPIVGVSVEDVAKEIDHDGHVYVFEDGRWTHNGEPMDEPEDDEPSDGRRRWSGKDDETLPPGWEVKPETEAYQLHAVGDVDSILTWRGIVWQLPDEGDYQDTETFGDGAFIMPGDWWMPMPSPPKDEP